MFMLTTAQQVVWDMDAEPMTVVNKDWDFFADSYFRMGLDDGTDDGETGS